MKRNRNKNRNKKQNKTRNRIPEKHRKVKYRRRWPAAFLMTALVGVLLFAFLRFYPRFSSELHHPADSSSFMSSSSAGTRQYAPYVRSVDKDNDGIDDQTDILNGAKDYIATKPKYKSKYYNSGYSDDGYGVCTDVVANALLAAGYDLMELVNQDVLENPDDYDIDEPDINIDFRRVKNLNVYFRHTALSLTTDTSYPSDWQGGDIVVFKKHIGIISDKRNKNGIPYVIHHISPAQIHYEEDILDSYSSIIGHYRIN